jgi:serine/threonine-protein kinase RsbW
LWQGSLGRYFSLRFDTHFNDPHRGYHALRVLQYLFRSEAQAADLPAFQDALDLPYDSLSSLLDALERTGWIEEQFGRISLDNNRVLKDWIEITIRKFIHKEARDQILPALERTIETRLEDLENGNQEITAGEREGLNFSITLPMNPESELVAVRALDQIATYTELDEDSIERTKLALIEACINAVEHSQSFEGKVQVHFSAHPHQLEIMVQDRGKAFDPEIMQSKMVMEKDPLSPKRGRGLSLIREMMDEVRFEAMEKGTRLYMVKRKRQV